MLRESLIVFKAGKTISYLVAIILISQSALAISQAWIPDPQPDYSLEVLPTVEHCNLLEYPTVASDSINGQGIAYFTGHFVTGRDPLKWYVECLSFKIAHTPKLIPIFFNLGLLPLVYLTTKVLTKDRLLSLIALVAFVANPLYSQWQTSATYDQIWSFFLLFSCYMIVSQNRSGFAVIPFVISLAAKSLGLLYLPSLVYSGRFKRLVKPQSGLAFIFLISVGIVLFVLFLFMQDGLSNFIGGQIGFHPENWHSAFVDNFGMLAYEFPIVAILGYVTWKYRPLHPNPIIKLCGIWMINSWFTTTVIYLFTNQFQFVYRFVPFAFFMSIFIAVALNDLVRHYMERSVKVSQE